MDSIGLSIPNHFHDRDSMGISRFRSIFLMFLLECVDKFLIDSIWRFE